MPRNPSEFFRLTEELDDLKDQLFNGYKSKSEKEKLLREIHEIERQLGIELTRYNGGTFKHK